MYIFLIHVFPCTELNHHVLEVVISFGARILAIVIFFFSSQKLRLICFKSFHNNDRMRGAMDTLSNTHSFIGRNVYEYYILGMNLT